jgi:hypothetical protein
MQSPKTFSCHPAILVLILFISLVAIASSIASDAHSGTVINSRGTVHIIRGDNQQTVHRGTQLLEGDRIQTGDNARVVMKMIDNAILTLGANSELRIHHYIYQSTQRQGSASLELLKGALRSVTGLIGKTPKKDFKVRTAVATIGIRGTDFWVGTLFGNATDVALFNGNAIFVENQAGRVEINIPGYGTTVKANDMPPSPPRKWGIEKFKAAMASVSLTANDPDLQQENDDY